MIENERQADGCTCHHCGRVYFLDLMVPSDLWERIKPQTSSEGGGLLCGGCISLRIENLKGFSVLYTTQGGDHHVGPRT